MSTMNSSQTVYQGPGTTYSTLGSVSSGETITFEWQEGTWAYIEYDVTGTGFKKRGYVPYSSVDNPGSATFTPSMSTRYLKRGCIPFYGPDNRGYVEMGDGVARKASVQYTGKKINNYAFCQLGTKRFYINADNLTTTYPTTSETGKSLTLPNYQQQDPDYEVLCDPSDLFADTGCAVCCAADVVSYVEDATCDPFEMKDRDVFETDDCNCKWYNASEQCDFRGIATPSNYLEQIYFHINSGLPVIIKLSGH